MYTIGYLPFLYTSFKNLGWKKALIFIFISGVIGFIAEWLSIKYGTVFGATYYYTSAMGLQFFGVPWMVIGYWGAFIFGAMGVSNYFFKSYRSFWDAIFTLLLDIPLEYVALRDKLWIWETGHAPIGNYIGWFLVAFLVSLIFRKIHKKVFRSKLVVLLYLLALLLIII